MGSLILLFSTSGNVSSGFQSKSEQPFSHLVEMYANRTLDDFVSFTSLYLL